MSLEKKKNALLWGTVVLILLSFFALGVEILLAVAARNEVEQGTTLDNLVVWMGLTLALLILLLGGTAFCIGARNALLRKARWASNLFGLEEVSVDGDVSFERKFRRAVIGADKQAAKDHLEQKDPDVPFLVAFQLREIRGQELANNIAALHQINAFVLSKMKEEFGPLNRPFGISERNDFFFYCPAKEGKVTLLKEELARFGSSLSNALDSRNDLPSVIVLFGAAQGSIAENPATTLSHAEFALSFDAGTRLSGSTEIYSESLVKQNEERKSLDEEIARALAHHEFEIYYQAKWDLKRNRFFGAEALIRWKHPKRGILPPSSFIPYCENSGRIVEIDHYVFETVCQDLARWKAEGRRRIVVSANLSRRSVYDPSLLSFLSETLKKNHVSPKDLDIELTESLAAQNVVFISSIIRRIRAMGFGTSMDDFGIGYSSLSSLKNIPFSVLKIDKSFIDDIEIDAKSRSMVHAIIDLSHTLGMQVIAEGVETRDQVKILQGLGLDSIQGFYFSRPLERARFEAFLESNIFEGKAQEEERK